jgi:hypothetical protein
MASEGILRFIDLFDRDPAHWSVEYLTFQRAGRLTLSGVRWEVKRTLAISEIGITAGLSLGPPKDLGRRDLERLGRNEWPRLVDAIVRAGFEDRSDLSAAHGYWLRPIQDPLLVGREWLFLRTLNLRSAARGGHLPSRPQSPIAHNSRRRIAGTCPQLFKVVRRQRGLMEDLAKVEYTRLVVDNFGGEPWHIRTNFSATRRSRFSVIQFHPESGCGERGVRLPRSFAPARRALHERGYFSPRKEDFLRYLPPAAAAEEKRFLETLRLAQLIKA